MTSLLRSLIPEQRTVSHASFNQALDEDRWPTTFAGVNVSQNTALRLSAVWTCVRLLTHDISSLPFDAYRQRAGERTQIEPKPAWIDEPDITDPAVTGPDHLSQVLLSLLLDGNAFVLAAPSVNIPFALHVLDPQRVQIKREAGKQTSYIVKDRRGQTQESFGPSQILHVPLWRRPGELRGLSPIEAMSQGIGRGIAAEEMGARYFGQGSTFGAVVQYPKDADPDDGQVKEVLDSLNKKHRGLRNAWAVGAITGGGELKELGLKPSDAQLIETEEWTLEQVARAYGVPPSLAGSQKPGAVAYASVEQRSIDYVVHAVLPLTVRLEKAYSRLLPRGSYVKFNLNGLLRGDAKTRWETYGIALDKKVMTRDEVRLLEDLNPFGGADGGLLETPNNNAPAGPAPEPTGVSSDASQE